MYSTGGEAQVARSTTRLISYYTANNTNADFQKPIYSTGTGDLYSSSLGYLPASFLKVRNISLAYNLDAKFLKKLTMSNLRLYFQIANPGMLSSKISYMDMDAVSPTFNRGFTFGINAGF